MSADNHQLHAASFTFKKTEFDKVVEKGSAGLKLEVYSGRVNPVVCGYGSGKLIGVVVVGFDGGKASGVVRNGWVDVGDLKKRVGLYLDVRVEPDPRFVFEFDGEPECSPQVFQVNGNVRQAVFTCKFSVRNSGIKEIPTVSYFEQHIPKEKVIKDVKIVIKDGSKPEVYTEEHEKMLGDHKEPWIVGVDGYDDEGNRMYDPYDGKSCHQCRQKTLGFRTKCCKCTSVQGKFCGDCLFQRYGENVEEANANPDWVCPVCRDICNCSRCRRVKGWEPTGNIYRKAVHLGYKSVAHYLIHTRGPNGKQEDTDTEGDLLDDKDDDNMDEDGKHLNNKDDDDMDEDGKHVPAEKSIKLHDRKNKSKGDDDDC
nr:cell division cycle-associated protein 7-like [Tanacetum cinerariifolium]